jgi:Domain of unknown function (DUF1707)
MLADMERGKQLRAADRDREETAERLRVAAGEGRITLAEFEERVRVAYYARTYGELDQLVGDLPEPAPAPPRGPGAGWGPRGIGSWSGTGVVGVAIAVLLAVSIGTGRAWTGWVAAVALFGAARRARHGGTRDPR